MFYYLERSWKMTFISYHIIIGCKIKERQILSLHLLITYSKYNTSLSSLFDIKCNKVF